MIQGQQIPNLRIKAGASISHTPLTTPETRLYGPSAYQCLHFQSRCRSLHGFSQPSTGIVAKVGQGRNECDMLLKFACNGRKTRNSLPLFATRSCTVVGSISMVTDVSWWPISSTWLPVRKFTFLIPVVSRGCIRRSSPSTIATPQGGNGSR